jgi:type 1 glutamine amidotransferase
MKRRALTFVLASMILAAGACSSSDSADPPTGSTSGSAGTGGSSAGPGGSGGSAGVAGNGGAGATANAGGATQAAGGSGGATAGAAGAAGTGSSAGAGGSTNAPDAAAGGSPPANDAGAGGAAGKGGAGGADAAPKDGGVAPPPPGPDGHSPFKVLVYTHTAGFRHTDGISGGIKAIRELGQANGFGVDIKGTTPDANGNYLDTSPTNAADMAYFTTANLAQYAVIVFLHTTTNPGSQASVILDAAGKAAFKDYINKGGGFVGIHSAADCEYFWPWYHDLLGATFKSHGVSSTAPVHIEDRGHPASAGLPDPWVGFTEEWYNFTANPRPTVHTLARLDDNYQGNPNPMGDHPVLWCKVFDGGRSFYTARGHWGTSFAEPAARASLLGGIMWAAGVVQADCSLPK